MTWSAYGKQNKWATPDQVFAMGVSNAYQAAGTLSSGTFQNNEVLTQTGTAATANYTYSTAAILYFNNLSGSPNSSGTWVGFSSGAIWAPSVAPTAAGQGLGTDAVAYKVGSGCSYLNTKTGVVTGDFGTTGTVGIADRFSIHNAKISKDGNWLLIEFQHCLSTTCTNDVNTPYFWQIGTTTLVAGCTSGNDCSGHYTEGVTHFINADGSPTSQQIKRLYSAPTSPTAIPIGLPWANSNCTGGYILGQHQNWANVDANDTYPFFYAGYSSAPPMSPFVCALAYEVDAVNPVTGTVYRFAHTFNSGQSGAIQTGDSIGAVSQDGRLYCWGTDDKGGFGSTAGAASCTLGTNCRSDLLCVQAR